jgi:hypothetical protein
MYIYIRKKKGKDKKKRCWPVTVWSTRLEVREKVKSIMLDNYINYILRSHIIFEVFRLKMFFDMILKSCWSNSYEFKSYYLYFIW